MCGFRDGKKNPETIFPVLFQKMRAPAVSLQPALLFFEDARYITVGFGSLSSRRVVFVTAVAISQPYSLSGSKGLSSP